MNDHERLIEPLIEESQDIHVDSMKAMNESLDELVEVSHERQAHRDPTVVDMGRFLAERRGLLRKSLAGAGAAVGASGLGAALLGVFDTPAWASSPMSATPSTQADIMILQTASSIEVLAISTYTTALTLPYIGGSSANKVVTAFAKTTMAQHMDHLQAFQSATTNLGGTKQTKPDPKYVPVVNTAVGMITKDSPTAGTAAVVDLAMTLEDVAAQTYVNDMSYLGDMMAKQTMASIMGVEAQHVAVLRAVKALLSDPSLIAIPPVDASLPSAAGNVGFPAAFYATSGASPATEGAVQ